MCEKLLLKTKFECHKSVVFVKINSLQTLKSRKVQNRSRKFGKSVILNLFFVVKFAKNETKLFSQPRKFQTKKLFWGFKIDTVDLKNILLLLTRKYYREMWKKFNVLSAYQRTRIKMGKGCAKTDFSCKFCDFSVCAFEIWKCLC